MGRSTRKANKRTLQGQVKVLGNVGDFVAGVAQDYTGPEYEKYEKVFKIVFTMLDQTKDLLNHLERML